jgi:hypothetical protein
MPRIPRAFSHFQCPFAVRPTPGKLAAQEIAGSRKVQCNRQFRGPAYPLGTRDQHLSHLERLLSPSFVQQQPPIGDFWHYQEGILADGTRQRQRPLCGNVRPLALSWMPPLAATSKQVALLPEKQIFTFRDGQFAKTIVEPTPGGGIPGILAQVGAEMPD